MHRLMAFWKRLGKISQDILVLLGAVLPWLLGPAMGAASLFQDRLRDKLAGIVREALSEDRFPYLWLAILPPLAAFAYAHPAPPDDLLRDLVSGLYHFNYSLAYWGSPRMMRGGDLDIGFDLLASGVHGLLPARFAFLPFQAAVLAGFAVGLPLALYRQMPGLQKRNAAQISVLLSVLVWTLPGFANRITSARPENFMALWVLAVFLLPRGRRIWFWIWAGVALIPSYWLSCAYFPASFLLPARRKTRILTFVLLGFWFLGFWLLYSHGEWLSWLLSLHTDIAKRVTGVSEDQPAGLLLLSFSGLLLLLLAAAFLWREKKTGIRMGWMQKLLPGIDEVRSSPWAVAALLAWFLIPDMIRYVDVLGPLSAVFIARMAQGNRARIEDWLQKARPMGAIAAILLPAWIFTYTFHADPLNDVRLPGYQPGQRVLAYFSSADYDALYENPGVRLAPAMEIGMTRQSVQRASMELKDGKVSCPDLWKWKVRWVVTPAMRWSAAKRPVCLRLVRIDRSGMTVWAVRK